MTAERPEGLPKHLIKDGTRTQHLSGDSDASPSANRPVRSAITSTSVPSLGVWLAFNGKSRAQGLPGLDRRAVR
jgi:hypothetical protein